LGLFSLLLLCWQASLSARAGDDFAVTVHGGDTLIGISQRYLENPERWPELKRLNRIKNDKHLQPASVVRIPMAWVRWSELSAEVVHATGTVRAILNGATSSAPTLLTAGMKLKAGDTFDTGTDGALTLRLSDGSTVVFAPKTQGGLGVSREISGTNVRTTIIDLRGGSAEIAVQPLKEPTSRFEIRTPRVVTAVRGTQFRVGADDNTSRHEVLSGAVAVAGVDAAGGSVVANPTTATRLGSAQGLRAEGSILGKVVPLLPAPSVTQVPQRIERTLQRLAVPASAGATAWRWQVAADAAFTQLLQDERTPEPVWHLTRLDDGDYHLRVRAADAQGLEGLGAQKPIQIRARPEPPVAFTPAPNADLVLGTSRFSWAENAQAASYHIQVARNAQFADPLLDKADVTGNTLTMEGAWAPGPYHWRLATVLQGGKHGPFGDPLSFTLIEPSAMAPPTLDEKTVRLAWSGPPNLDHRIQVANDLAFSTLAHDQTVKGLQMTMDTPEAGVYYVRTLAILPNGSEGPWSAPQRFEVPRKHPWGLLLLLILPFL
jgi:hypothetical protein